MTEHLTFWQTVVIASLHAGPPTLAVFVSYLALRKRHDKKHQEITILLNGGLQDKIKKAVEDALKS